MISRQWPAAHRVPSERTSFRTAVHHSDVLVLPFESLLQQGPRGFHDGGPLWPDWDESGPARLWFATGASYGPIDSKPQQRTPVRHLRGGRFFWIGPVVHHFGHQLRDFSTRIIGSLHADPEAVLVYATRGDGRPPPPWFWQVNDWYGVPRSRVLVITEPTVFEHLRVVPQPEWSGPNPMAAPPDAAYLDALTVHARERLGPVPRTRALLVSRGRMPWGQVLGDQVLDRWLRSEGVRVFHPELHPIERQLRTYVGAETLIFVGGSAVHGTQLLGRNLGRCIVIPRQPDLWDYRGPLEPRSRELHVLDAVERIVTLRGRLAGANAKVFMHSDRIAHGLVELGVLPPGATSRGRRYRFAAGLELVAWSMVAVLRRIARRLVVLAGRGRSS